MYDIPILPSLASFFSHRCLRASIVSLFFFSLLLPPSLGMGPGVRLFESCELVGFFFFSLFHLFPLSLFVPLVIFWFSFSLDITLQKKQEIP